MHFILTIQFLFFSVVLSLLLSTTFAYDEPSCTSRFDHDFKVSQKLAMLEVKQQTLSETDREQDAKIKEQDAKIKEQDININKLTIELALTNAKHHPVAFAAQLGGDLNGLAQGSTIAFDIVLENTGKSYDPHSGVFTAMHAGVYFFIAKLSSPTSTQIWIMKNTVNYDYVFAPGDGWKTGTASTTIRLELGDRVWVEGKADVKGQTSYTWPTLPRKCYHTSFSGFMISHI